jgi:hypothetical protein
MSNMEMLDLDDLECVSGGLLVGDSPSDRTLYIVDDRTGDILGDVPSDATKLIDKIPEVYNVSKDKIGRQQYAFIFKKKFPY